MRVLRVTFVWVFVVAIALFATVSAQDDEPKTPEPTSSANARDSDPVIQEVRGLRNSGMKLNDGKDFKGAIEKLRGAITLMHNRVFGEGRHEITDPADISQDAALYAQILNDYGSVLIRAKQYDEAIEVLEDSVAMVEKIYGDSHPSLGLSLRSLADAYMAKEQYKKAIGKYKTLRKHVKKGLGVTHEAYIEASLRIAEGYKKLDNKKKNLKTLKDALTAQGGEINGLTTGIAELYMELSTAHVAVNEIDEALRAAEMASTIFLQRDGEETLSYAFSLNALAGVKMRQKKVDDAIKLLEHAHRIAVKIYGENDAITQASAKTLREVKEYKLDLQAEKDEL
ncbi:RxLR effector protein [Phytophthora megakarya]|uniref:RxLR effector protein n=1 Tax=Phytophthora megakarya TaxID=4795 RepID=A0A225V3I9_9STRA|nr:RxLR effector protein [Phytophthora megakarya]